MVCRLHLDNAKEFRSEALRRGCEQYGIAIDYRPVRTPHYGGHIERLIGTMMEKVHLLGGFYSVTAALKIHQSPGFSRYQSRTKYSIDGWLHLGPDLTSNFAQARTAPRESGLAERLVARVQLTRSVVLFS